MVAGAGLGRCIKPGKSRHPLDRNLRSSSRIRASVILSQPPSHVGQETARVYPHSRLSTTICLFFACAGRYPEEIFVTRS